MESLKRLSRLLIRIRHLIHQESGQDLIEYALLTALVALGVTAALASFSAEVGHAFQTIARAVHRDFRRY